MIHPVKKKVRGLLVPGNIDLHHRPVVRNPDGTISTVRSASFGIDGREVLLPTVSEDGRIMTSEEALDAYRKTGRHLGIFEDSGSADAYARELHREQDFEYGAPTDSFRSTLPDALRVQTEGLKYALGGPVPKKKSRPSLADPAKASSTYVAPGINGPKGKNYKIAHSLLHELLTSPVVQPLAKEIAYRIGKSRGGSNPYEWENITEKSTPDLLRQYIYGDAEGMVPVQDSALIDYLKRSFNPQRDPQGKYFTIPDENVDLNQEELKRLLSHHPDILEKVNKLKEGERLNLGPYTESVGGQVFNKERSKGLLNEIFSTNYHTGGVSSGIVKRDGKPRFYVYDVYDFEPVSYRKKYHFYPNVEAMDAVGTPFGLYKEMDYTGKPQERKKGIPDSVDVYNQMLDALFEHRNDPAFKTRIDHIRELRDRASLNIKASGGLIPMKHTSFSYATGGSIHINPSHRGLFTAWAKRHGMEVQEAARRVMKNREDYSPAIVKRANFARNASRFHGYGGILHPKDSYGLGGSILLHGPRHEEGGIPYKGAEVEGGEVIQRIGDVDYVLSNRLRVPGTRDTFAQHFRKMKKEGASDRDKLRLMRIQDNIRDASPRMQMGLGGILKKALPLAAPLAITALTGGAGAPALLGSGLLSKALTYAPAAANLARGLFGKDHTETITPQLVDRSSLGALRSMRTDYDANPELARIEEQTRALQADPSATGAQKLLAQTNALRATSGVLANKQNVETGLHNERQTRLADLTSRFDLADQDALNRASFANADLRMQSRAARENLIGSGLSQLSQIAQQGQANKIGLAAATAGLDPGVRDEFLKRMGIGQGGDFLEGLRKLLRKKRLPDGAPVTDSFPIPSDLA